MRKRNTRTLSSRSKSRKIRPLRFRWPNLIAVILIFIGLGLAGVRYLHHSHADAGEVNFRLECDIDHVGPDDPIVYPGVPGASHMHSFYGNKSTDAYTTPASLTAQKGSCNYNGDFDRSAYWIPSTYFTDANGAATRYANTSQQLIVYYSRPGGAAGPRITPFPAGFRMIAGDAKATSPQPSSISSWDCGDGGPSFPTIPDCSNSSSGNIPVGAIEFPNCWDGVHLDSADHKSHMAYHLANYTCPADHPVAVPQLHYEDWLIGTTGGPKYYLSSGSYSLHGDFFAAWDSRLLNGLIDNCFNTYQRECSPVMYVSNNGDVNVGGTNLFNLNNYTATPTQGDINKSGKVDLVDLSTLLSKWGTSDTSTDLDKNGTVGLSDLSILLSHWGT